MKKMKKFGAILMAGALSLGVCAFAACGGDASKEKADAYTLIVKDSEGNVMKDYHITICKVVDGEKAACEVPQATDENGKVVFNVPEGTWAVSDANPNDNITLQGDYYLADYSTMNVIVNVAK